MPELLTEKSLLSDAIWQSSLWLGAGLLLARLLARRPARAHAVLLLCTLAAVATPLGSGLVRRLDWGLFPGASAETVNGALPDGAELAAPHEGSVWTAERAFLLGWAALSGLLSLRLALGVARSRRFVREAQAGARPLGPLGRTAALRASRRLHLSVVPEAVTSPGVASPVIWCWGRRPVVFLPFQEVEPRHSELVGVLCHELAHFKRRDHWASLAATIVGCALPWQPLAWIARARLGELGEEACDGWVVATGEDPADYAETLLGLVPRPAGAHVLAAVSSRSALARRVRNLLRRDPAVPRPGNAVLCASASAVVLMTAGLALAQERAPEPPPVPLAGAFPEKPVLELPGGVPFAVHPRELDLGVAPPGEARTDTVWLAYTGERPARVLKVSASCGCTVVSPDLEGVVLQPGEVRELLVTMTPSDEVGEHKTKHVTILIQGRPPLKLPVHLRTIAPEE